MLTEEIRDTTYETATLVQKYLYSSGEAGNKLRTIAESQSLESPDLYSKFAITVGDIILGFYNVEDTEPLLIQELGISAEVAKLLAEEVREFLAPLDDPNWQPPTEEELEYSTTESVQTIPEDSQPAALDTEPDPTPVSATPTASSTSTPPPPPPDAPAPPTTTAPNTPPQPNVTPVSPDTPGLRTMAHDMQDARSPQRHTFEPIPEDDVPTYTSSQS